MRGQWQYRGTDAIRLLAAGERLCAARGFLGVSVGGSRHHRPFSSLHPAHGLWHHGAGVFPDDMAR